MRSLASRAAHMARRNEHRIRHFCFLETMMTTPLRRGSSTYIDAGSGDGDDDDDGPPGCRFCFRRSIRVARFVRFSSARCFALCLRVGGGGLDIAVVDLVRMNALRL